ncbi:MAG: WG repeat-containing protein [Chitinophagales bacterium]
MPFCPECGTEYCDGLEACNCKLELVDEQPEQQSSKQNPAIGYEYAGFWRRLVAFIIDYGIYVVIGLLCGMVVPNMGSLSIFFVLYCALMEGSSKKATLGKMVMGLIVTDLSGNRISFKRSFARIILMGLLPMCVMMVTAGILYEFYRFVNRVDMIILLSMSYLFTCLIIGLFIIFTTRRQALHDLIGGCLVLHQSAVETNENQRIPTINSKPAGLRLLSNKRFWEISLILVLIFVGTYKSWDVYRHQIHGAVRTISPTEQLYLIKSKGLYGFMDRKGQMVIPASFDSIIRDFGDDKLAAVSNHSKWGFINRQGELVVDFQFEEIRSFSEGLAPVKTKNMWGFINEKGEMVIPAKFTEAYTFSDGLASVELNGHWFAIDKQGNPVIKMSSLSFFNDGLADRQIKGKYGFINSGGKVAIPAVYQSVHSFSEGFAGVLVDEKWGFIDKSGKLVIPARYDMVYQFKGGLAPVFVANPTDPMNKYSGAGKWGFIDKAGKTVIKPKFAAVYASGEFSEGLAAVNFGDSNKKHSFMGLMGEDSEKQWGYINIKGETVLRPQYSRAGDFNGGLASVSIDGKNGYIDRTGKVIRWETNGPGEKITDVLERFHIIIREQLGRLIDVNSEIYP